MSKVTTTISMHGCEVDEDRRLPLAGGFLIAIGLSLMLWSLIVLLVFA